LFSRRERWRARYYFRWRQRVSPRAVAACCDAYAALRARDSDITPWRERYAVTRVTARARHHAGERHATLLRQL